MGTRTAVSTIKLEFKSQVKNTLTNGVPATWSMGKAVINDTLTNGVSINQSNRAWENRDIALTSAATDTIDLYDLGSIDIGAGAGADGVGQALVFEEIVGIIIVNESTSTGSLEVFPNAVNGWDPIGIHTVALGGALPPDGMLMKYSPNTDAFDVTDASSHKIDLKASGGNLTYSIYVIGRHDDDDSSSSSSSSSSSLSSSSTSSQSTSSSLSSSSTSSLSSSSTS